MCRGGREGWEHISELSGLELRWIKTIKFSKMGIILRTFMLTFFSTSLLPLYDVVQFTLNGASPSKLCLISAKRLSLYQILAPNAFDYVEGFVASLNKSIKSSNYERQMVNASLSM